MSPLFTAISFYGTITLLLFIFPVPSLRYRCLPYLKALFIINDRPHLLHDILFSHLRHDEPASQTQNTVESMRLHMQIAPLHADFSHPHC